MSTSTLDSLLDADQSLDPVTVDGLSNHLSMGLIGMSGLDADDEKMRRFAEDWRARLVDRRAGTNPIEPDAWAAALGTGRRYGDLLGFFTEAIEERGLDQTLDDTLGTLLDGVGGAAFHGVIRLAYALEHGRPGDVACGLAYLADVHAPVEPPSELASQTGRGASVSGLLASLAENRSTASRRRGPGSFSDDFRTVVADSSFRQVMDGFTVGETTLEQTASAAHALYRSSRDFFALHTVTGSHAARIAIDRVDDHDRRLRAVGSVARAMAAAYVVIGTPPVAPAPPRSDSPEVPNWSTIGEAAIDSGDVHLIKMTYTCKQEQAYWNEPVYRVTAAEVTGLLPA